MTGQARQGRLQLEHLHKWTRGRKRSTTKTRLRPAIVNVPSRVICLPRLAAPGIARYKTVMFEKASWAVAIAAIVFATAVGLGYIPPV